MMPGTNELWRAGSDVSVNSPMAILDQVMKIRTATFTQDSRGTLTTLDLVIPWLLRDKAPGGPNIPDDPARTQTPIVPPTPPAQTAPRPPETPAPTPHTFQWPYPS